MKISINSLVGLGTNFQQTMFYKQLGTFHLMFTPPLYGWVFLKGDSKVVFEGLSLSAFFDLCDISEG